MLDVLVGVVVNAVVDPIVLHASTMSLAVP